MALVNNALTLALLAAWAAMLPSAALAQYVPAPPPVPAPASASSLSAESAALFAKQEELQMAIRVVSAGTEAVMTQNAATGETFSRSTQAPATVRDIPAPDNAARSKALLEAGADPNKKYGDLTPLMLAIGLPKRPGEMADNLVDFGGRIEFEATISAADPREASIAALPVATLSTTLRGEMSQWLFNDQGLLTGMSAGPLTWAALHGRPDIALRLLQRDKKMARADRFVLYFAAVAGHWDLVTGALPYAKEVNLADRAGVTPLMLAAHAGRTDAIRALLAAGASVNLRSAKQWLPLLETNFLAALGGHSSRPILVGDYTALRAARERGHAEAVKVLSEAGGKE